jgi:hypothetical protein
MKKRSAQRKLALLFTLSVLMLGIYAADLISFSHSHMELFDLLNSPFGETVSLQKVVLFIVEIVNYSLEG